MIRFLAPPDMQRFFDDDIRGTALDHLSKGLVEAHARDEAGHGDEAGHDRMWYAVRDIAFENPVTQDETELMLRRMGISFGDRKSVVKGKSVSVRVKPGGPPNHKKKK